MATLLMFCNAAKERMRTLTRILAIRLLDVSPEARLIHNAHPRA